MRTLGYLLLGVAIVIAAKWLIPYVLSPSLFRPVTSYGALPFVLIGLVAIALVARRVGRQR